MSNETETTIREVNQPEPLPEVVTADEVARLLRVNRKTLYAAFKAGEIQGGRRIGGTIRFHRDQVLQWLRDGQVGVSPAQKGSAR